MSLRRSSASRSSRARRAATWSSKRSRSPSALATRSRSSIRSAVGAMCSTVLAPLPTGCESSRGTLLVVLWDAGGNALNSSAGSIASDPSGLREAENLPALAERRFRTAARLGGLSQRQWLVFPSVP